MRHRATVLLSAILLGLLAWFFADTFASPTDGPPPPRPAVDRTAPAATGTGPVDRPGADPSRQPEPERPGQEPFRSVDRDGQPVEPATRDGLTVVFLDPLDRPLAGHPVRVGWRKGWGRYGRDQGRTDDQGRFPTTIAEPRMIESAEVPDLGGREYTGYGPFDPDRDGRVVVQVPKLVRLTGRIQDLDGNPVPGARGKYEWESTLGEPGRSSLKVATGGFEADDNGGFGFDAPVGIYAIEFEKPKGYDLLHAAIVYADGSTDAVRFHGYLHRSGTGRDVQVTVTWPEHIAGQPKVLTSTLGLADGIAAEPGVEYTEPARTPAASQAGPGIYAIPDVPPGPFEVRAVLAGCATGRVRVDSGATAARIDLSAAADGKPPAAKAATITVRGTVRRADGSPFAHRKVRLLRDARILWGPSSETDKMGTFAIQVEPGGPAVVMAVDSGTHAMLGTVDLSREPEPLDLTLPALDGEIRGVVVDGAGQPVEAQVQVYRKLGSLSRITKGDPEAFVHHCPQEETAVSAAGDGSFRLQGLPQAAEVELIAMHFEGRHPRGRALARVGASGVRITMGLGFSDDVRVRGKITDARTGEPIAGVSIRGSLEDEDGRSLGQVLTDAKGRFQLAGGDPGRHGFFLECRGYAVLETEVLRLERGEHVRDFALSPATTAYVAVVDGDGRPLQGLSVEAFDADTGRPLLFQDENGRPEFNAPVTDLAGRVDLRGLPMRRVKLVFDGEESFRVNARQARGAARKLRVERLLDLREPRFGKIVLKLGG